MLACSEIPIHWQKQPMSAVLKSAVRPQGMTISEIVASLPPSDLPRRFWVDGEVRINGHMIPQARWDVVRPRVRHDFDVVVTLHMPLHGGGSGGGSGQKNPLATVAAIALLVVTSAVSGGALGPLGLGLAGFGAGAPGAIFASAAIGSAGQGGFDVLG